MGTPELSLKIFSIRLKKLREEKGLSINSLAEELGVAPSTISRYESGKRDPEFSMVYKIATYFDRSIEYLCGEDISSNTAELMDIINKLSDNQKKDVMRYALFVLERGDD